jgi:hypothetical protein
MPPNPTSVPPASPDLPNPALEAGKLTSLAKAESGLANQRLQPLGHLSKPLFAMIYETVSQRGLTI